MKVDNLMDAQEQVNKNDIVMYLADMYYHIKQEQESLGASVEEIWYNDNGNKRFGGIIIRGRK